MHLASGIRQTPADIDLNRFAGARHGENDSVDAVLSDQGRNVIGRIDPQPRDGEPLQASVVIDKATACNASSVLSAEASCCPV